jgi:ring-1,2-phenylacetyl-CoA epoxidase subunit PaaD
LEEQSPSSQRIRRAQQALSQIPDPEIPVITIAELGILREVRAADDGVLEVIITPTYNGCPAMHQIEDDIRVALNGAGLAPHRIITTLTPAWTTDWMIEAAKVKLRDYGIAPPCTTASENVIAIARRRNTTAVPCPRCNSTNTTETSHFGSTACKALYKCLACEEPFDYFKPH